MGDPQQGRPSIKLTAFASRRLEGSWIYAPILFLPKVYTITYYLMLLSSVESPQPQPSSRNSLALADWRGAVGVNLVETVEYNWGKGKESGSNPSSSEGVVTVTGLPLSAIPFAFQQTYQPPFPEPGEDSPPRSLNAGHRRRTSLHSQSTPPSSPFLGLSSRPVAYPSFPPAPQMSHPRTPPRLHGSHRSSRSRSPPSSPLRSSFRMARVAEFPDDVITEESEEGHHEGKSQGGVSGLMQIVGEDDEKTLASYRFGSERRGVSRRADVRQPG